MGMNRLKALNLKNNFKMIFKIIDDTRPAGLDDFLQAAAFHGGGVTVGQTDVF